MDWLRASKKFRGKNEGQSAAMGKGGEDEEEKRDFSLKCFTNVQDHTLVQNTLNKSLLILLLLLLLLPLLILLLLLVIITNIKNSF